jgi:hypothetical protein
LLLLLAAAVAVTAGPSIHLKRNVADEGIEEEQVKKYSKTASQNKLERFDIRLRRHDSQHNDAQHNGLICDT